VVALVAKPEALNQPTEFLGFLGESIVVPFARRRELLAEALARKPGDLGLLMAMGGTFRLSINETAAERVRWYQSALAVAPLNKGILHNLGNGLKDVGDLTGASRCYRRAIELDPTFVWPHVGLGIVYEVQGNYAAAEVEAELTIRLSSSQPSALPLGHNLLGLVRLKQGDTTGAAEALRKAHELTPDAPWVLTNLGRVRFAEGDIDGAISFYEQSIAQESKAAFTHIALGYAFYAKGDTERAIACYRTSAGLEPRNPWPHFNSGLALLERGNLDAAERFFEFALSRAPELAGAKTYLRQLRSWKEQLPRLPEIIAGRATARTPREAIDIAELCRQPFQKQYHAAVRLYGSALKADPKLDDLRTSRDERFVRYNAACSASLAAAGQDATSPAVAVEEWAYLTELAYNWLQEELALLREQLKDPANVSRIRQQLRRWKHDSDFVAVRDPRWLASMTEPDRRRWQKLWADVDRLLQQAVQMPTMPASK
jgi:tetratricopeptide (TPR) repeat protein